MLKQKSNNHLCCIINHLFKVINCRIIDNYGLHTSTGVTVRQERLKLKQQVCHVPSCPHSVAPVFSPALINERRARRLTGTPREAQTL